MTKLCKKLRKKFLVLKHFLGRGPRYHLLYLRWHLLQICQRAFPFAYTGPVTDKHRALAVQIRTREKPSFFFEPEQTARIVATVPQALRTATVAAADKISQREFSFRMSTPVRFRDTIDWLLAPDGNTDWRWDLNRHAYFETLGFAWHYTHDERYVRHFAALLEDWLEANPPRWNAANWSASFEVGFRINAWVFALYLFRQSSALNDATLARLIRGIEAHCQYLFVNLERHGENNHLLLESKALLLAAMLIPEFEHAAHWEKKARKTLYAQVRKQVCDDGVHGERSTHYHRVIAGELLELHLLHRVNNTALPDDIVETIRRMCEFQIAVTRPDGTLPLIGDSSQQDTYARVDAARAGPVVFKLPAASHEVPGEAEIWRLGDTLAHSAPVAESRPSASVAFEEGGYYVMRSHDSAVGAMHLCADCGPFGLPSDPHHGHADALSIDAFAGHRAWIVDSGVYSTHAEWKWRHYFRGTRSHNTVVVDGLDQSELLDSRRVLRQAVACCHLWRQSRHVDLFDGSHDGYERLAAPVRHRRLVWFVRGEYWLVVDLLTGNGEHDLELLFHFPTDVRATLETGGLAASLHAGPAESFLLCAEASDTMSASIITGQEQPVQGWRSRNSGEKLPAATLALQSRSAMPFGVATLLLPGWQKGAARPILSLAPDFALPKSHLAVSIEFAEWTDRVFRRMTPGDDELRFASYRTNASAAFVRESGMDREPIRAIAFDGTLRDSHGSELSQL
jgi:uncharacterized heparinase superfamily protein